ncbi:MAG: 50S ribosomal protein L13 [Candidatus Bathyarchaeota archaeon BA2]|nr:MAG: 50S ribosomal protein L13 [Candidatus Bathyarchaeota archaeon BA2]
MVAEYAVVIDAKGLILGRMASIIANRLLQGETIIIVNAEKAAVSGKRLSRVREAKTFLEVGHPRKGPYHPRRPDGIVRRAIRGMLPRKKPKGQQAYKRLKVFLGIPQELKDKEAQTIPEASAERLRCPYITVGEIAKEVGWTPTGE